VDVPQQEWLKILGKGMVTIPKKWRKELGLETGDVVKARKTGNRVVIESTKESKPSYRVYSDKEIDAFIKEDAVSDSLVQKVQKKYSLKK
jgi:AbrB family looped-hinge helix DNA binding protein